MPACFFPSWFALLAESLGLGDVLVSHAPFLNPLNIEQSSIIIIMLFTNSRAHIASGERKYV